MSRLPLYEAPAPARLALFLVTLLPYVAVADTVVLNCTPSGGPIRFSHNISFDESARKLWVDGWQVRGSVDFSETVIASTYHPPGEQDDWNLNRVTGVWRHHTEKYDEGGMCHAVTKKSSSWRSAASGLTTAARGQVAAHQRPPIGDERCRSFSFSAAA
jgi:hypothetical protein